MKVEIKFCDENDAVLFATECEEYEADGEVARQIQTFADAGLDVDGLYAYCEELFTNWDFEGVSDRRVIVGKDRPGKPRVEFLAGMIDKVKPIK